MNRLRLTLLLGLLLLTGHSASAQNPKFAALSAAFAGCDVLDEGLRSKILQHIQRDSASQELELDLGAKLLAFSPTSLRLQTSQVGRWELRLLPLLGGNSLTAVIETVLAPQQDARLTLLDREGKVIPATAQPVLSLPQARDFLAPMALPASWASSRLEELLHPLHYDLSWSADAEATLLIRPALLLSEEDRKSEELTQLIAQLPTLTYRWTGASFVLQPPIH